MALDPIKSISGLWLIIPDFDIQSRSVGTCSVSNLPRRSGDVGIFRPYLDNAYIEEEGFYDITQAAIEDAAYLLGWFSPEAHEAEVADLRKQAQSKQTRIMHDGRKIARLEARLAELEGE